MKAAHKLFPIAGVEQDCILSMSGAITLAYQLQLPEVYTLEEKEYDAYHHAWVKAIKLLPEHTVLHKQDWFQERQVQVEDGAGFLASASDRFYAGRPYLAHTCYLFLTKKPQDNKPSNSASCNLLRSSLVPKLVLDSHILQAFEDVAGQFAHVLEDSGFIQIQRLCGEQLAGTTERTGILERYCFLLDEENRHI